MGYWSTTAPSGINFSAGVSGEGGLYKDSNNLQFKVYAKGVRGTGSAYYVKLTARFYTAPSSTRYNPPSSCSVSCSGDTGSISVPSSTSSSGTDRVIYYYGSGGSTSSSLVVYPKGTCSNPYATSQATLYIPKIATYTVTYNGNGSDGGSTAKGTKTSGTKYVISSCGYTKKGYQFVEWNTNPDGTGTGYDPGDEYTTNANLTLYAIWAKTTVPLYLNVNGEIVESDSIHINVNGTVYEGQVYMNVNGTILEVT